MTRTFWLKGVALLTSIVLSATLLAQQESPPNSLPIAEIEEFIDVLELIKKNYVAEKSDAELIQYAINGMLSSLDGQSRYLSPDQLKRFERIAKGIASSKGSISSSILESNIGYIKIESFYPSTAVEISSAVNQLLSDNIQSLILDVRNNPGGRLDSAIETANLFLDSGIIVSAVGRVAQANQIYTAQSDTIADNIPMVVLVNNNSASAAEILTAALQDHQRATVIGTRSYGKGSIQSLIYTKQAGIQITTSLYLSPSGRAIHNNGIKPDIVQPLNDLEDTENADAQLQKAMAWLHKTTDQKARGLIK